MNRVAVTYQGVTPPSWTRACVRFCLKILKALAKDRWDVSLLLCHDEFIHGLNARYRHIDRPTDVLTFPQAEGELPPGNFPDGNARFTAGDVVVSLDRLRANCQNYGVSEDEELKRLLVHGFLHLAGQDHHTDHEEEPMLVEQERLLAALQKERII